MSIGKEFDCHQRWSVIKSTHSWVNDDKTPDIFQSQIWSPPPPQTGQLKNPRSIFIFHFLDSFLFLMF